MKKTLPSFADSCMHSINAISQFGQLTAPDHMEHPRWRAPLPLPGVDEQPILDCYEQADINAWSDFRELRMSIDVRFVAGDRVVTIWPAAGTLAAADRSATIPGISIDRITGGRIAETWASMDRLGIFQQRDSLPSGLIDDLTRSF